MVLSFTHWHPSFFCRHRRYITHDELNALLLQLNLRVDDRQLSVLAACLDVNDDGQIGYNEFMDFALSPPEVCGLYLFSHRAWPG